MKNKHTVFGLPVEVSVVRDGNLPRLLVELQTGPHNWITCDSSVSYSSIVTIILICCFNLELILRIYMDFKIILISVYLYFVWNKEFVGSITYKEQIRNAIKYL